MERGDVYRFSPLKNQNRASQRIAKNENSLSPLAKEVGSFRAI
jgi:hypothetical protein